MSAPATTGATTRRAAIDTDTLKRRADLLRELPHQLYKIAGTKGGEYAGPCPKCGGTDRFHAQPDRPDGARWACRQCHPKLGDVIELRMWLHGETFLEACRALGAVIDLPPVARPAQHSTPGGGTSKPYYLPAAPCRVIARYDYFDPFTGALTCQKERIEPGFNGARKTFRWRHAKPGVEQPDTNNPDHWLLGSGAAQPWLYGLPQILKAIAPQKSQPTIFVVDGEKDVLQAQALGLIACCPPHGWGSWRRDFSALFFDVPVVVVPDQEHGGLEGAQKIAQSIYEFTDHVRLLPALPSERGADDAG